MNNMVAFDKDHKIVKYDNVNDILYEYINVASRKIILIENNICFPNYKKKLTLLEIKIRFINDFIEEKIHIIRQNKANIEPN